MMSSEPGPAMGAGRPAEGGVYTAMKRHEVRLLRDAGLTQARVSETAEVSERTVRRIEGEEPTAPTAEALAKVRGVGRPSKAEAFRGFVAEILQEEPALPTVEVLHRARERGFQGGKSGLYALVAEMRCRDDSSLGLARSSRALAASKRRKHDQQGTHRVLPPRHAVTGLRLRQRDPNEDTPARLAQILKTRRGRTQRRPGALDLRVRGPPVGRDSTGGSKAPKLDPEPLNVAWDEDRLSRWQDLPRKSVSWSEVSGNQSAAAIYTACRTRARLGIIYTGGSEPGCEREISPHEMFRVSRALYVSAYCHLRRETRTFRVDRIRLLGSAEPLRGPRSGAPEPRLTTSARPTPPSSGSDSELPRPAPQGCLLAAVVMLGSGVAAFTVLGAIILGG
jgi:transcriptional regulator with XRE-family HTH domain